MAPPLGRLGHGVTLLVHVRLCPAALVTVDALAAELRPQRDRAAFRRAEALRMATLEWLKERQARRVRVTTVTAPSPPAVPAAAEPRTHEAAAAAEKAAMAATPAPPKRPGRARAGR
jgi:hypothetical protein